MDYLGASGGSNLWRETERERERERERGWKLRGWLGAACLGRCAVAIGLDLVSIIHLLLFPFLSSLHRIFLAAWHAAM